MSYRQHLVSEFTWKIHQIVALFDKYLIHGLKCKYRNMDVTMFYCWKHSIGCSTNLCGRSSDDMSPVFLYTMLTFFKYSIIQIVQ